MNLDLDTFLTTVYCLVDDAYKSEFGPCGPPRRGRKGYMSDSEVLTLLIMAQWQQDRSESAFLRYAHRHLKSYFPKLTSQSAFNRRARNLTAIVAKIGLRLGELARSLLGFEYPHQVLDGVPVPLMAKERGEHHRLFTSEADIGCGGSDRDFYYGVQLLVAASSRGIITGFVFAPASSSLRWQTEALLTWRLSPGCALPQPEQLESVLGKSHKKGGRRLGAKSLSHPWTVGEPGPGLYLADRGLRGENWARHWQARYGVSVLTPSSYRQLPKPLRRSHCRTLSKLRQVIENVNAYLKCVLGLSHPKARSPWGLLTRISAKVAAFNLCAYLNTLWQRPLFSHLSPLS